MRVHKIYFTGAKMSLWEAEAGDLQLVSTLQLLSHHSTVDTETMALSVSSE